MQEINYNSEGHSDEEFKKFMNNFCFEIATNLSNIRNKKGLSAEKLADKANIDKSHIYRIENAKKNVGLESLVKLSMALETPLEEIIPKLVEKNPTKIEIDECLKNMSSDELEEVLKDLRAKKKMKENSYE